jgi:antiviral helicase SLH1
LQAKEGWVLVVTPTRVATLEMITELRRCSQNTDILLEFGGDNAQIFSDSKKRIIRVVSTDQLLTTFSTKNAFASVQNLHLVVCDGLEQLDPKYELSVSLLRLKQQSTPTRYLGVSSSLNDASDLANWLHVDSLAVNSFRPQDRDQSLVTFRQTFSIPYSASLFKAMAKPAHLAIQNSPKGSSAIVFVPSRGQCRSIALDLITRCTLEMETGRGYIPDEISDDLVGDYAARLQDTTLLDFVLKGVGFFHSGIPKGDRILMLEMFAENIIRVLIVPKDSCWSLPARAAVVIVMGTQYVHFEEKGASRQIRDYSLTELVRMQSRAIQQTGTGYFHLFCQAEALETYSRFLDDGLPLESQLFDSQLLRDWVRSFSSGNVDKQRLVDALSFTFLSHRVVSNPSYYGFIGRDRRENLSVIADQVVDDIYKKTPSVP